MGTAESGGNFLWVHNCDKHFSLKTQSDDDKWSFNAHIPRFEMLKKPSSLRWALFLLDKNGLKKKNNKKFNLSQTSPNAKSLSWR